MTSRIATSFLDSLTTKGSREEGMYTLPIICICMYIIQLEEKYTYSTDLITSTWQHKYAEIHIHIYSRIHT